MPRPRRREIEAPIARGASSADQFAESLDLLGFRRVAEVRKQRRDATLVRSGHTIEIVLDDVEQVGAFVELECMPTKPKWKTPKKAIASLAAELGLRENERKSYLELLLERR